MSHMFSLLPLSLCLFHSFCVDPLMSVSQASYGHRRSLAFHCLFSGPETGGSLREVKCKTWKEKKMTKMKKRKRQVECSEGCINPHSTASQREIMQLVVSAWKWLHFIFLIEPPAAPTSQAGPAYQDLKGRRHHIGHFKNPQQVRTGRSGSKPKCLRPSREGGIYLPFTCVPVNLPNSLQRYWLLSCVAKATDYKNTYSHVRLDVPSL